MGYGGQVVGVWGFFWQKWGVLSGEGGYGGGRGGVWGSYTPLSSPLFCFTYGCQYAILPCSCIIVVAFYLYANDIKISIEIWNHKMMNIYERIRIRFYPSLQVCRLLMLQRSKKGLPP